LPFALGVVWAVCVDASVGTCPFWDFDAAADADFFFLNHNMGHLMSSQRECVLTLRKSCLSDSRTQP
jgi:hypothetical protein